MRLRLDGYLLREIIPPFFVALLAFLVFIGLELILSLSDALFARGVSAASLLRLLSYKLPNILTLAAPAGVLLATFLALARLASDRELLAFQALGYSLRRLLLPFFSFGLIISALSFGFSELVVPSAEARYRQELLTLLYRGPTPLIQEHVFFRGPQGELFYAERYTGEKIQGIVVYDLAGQLYPRSSFPAVITAREGLLSSGQLVLKEGRLMHFGSQGELTEILAFQELTLAVGQDLEDVILGGRTPSEMSTRELRQRIELLRKSGHDVRDLLVEYHGKLAVAAAALVFVLFGAPLGAILGHRGRATGMVVGFLLAAGAQALFLWARTLARRGFLPPALGGWLPHLVFGTVGLLLFCGADRLRFRGLLLFALWGVMAIGAPPFTELVAEELVVEQDGTAFLATDARLTLPEYTLTAHRLSLREGEGWILEAWGAEVSSPKTRVRAEFLRAQLAAEGTLLKADLQNFSGETTFSGPEKEETLHFSAQEGEVIFAEGAISQVTGKNVTFTTCPCPDGAPYLVWAEEFFFAREKWLFARNLRVHSFGYPIVWLPFYATRVGEESVPFLPEIGRSIWGWFFRWSFPWAVGQDAVGAFIFTVHPEVGRIEPVLQARWADGNFYLAQDRVSFWAQGKLLGEVWRVRGQYDTTGLLFSLTGRLGGWGLDVQAGLAETESSKYTRLPEITLRQNFSVLEGNMDLRVGFGRYQEGEAQGWRAGLSGTWNWSGEIHFARLQFPVGFGLDQYPGTERMYVFVRPNLSLGAITLWYEGRVTWGRSLFTFDAVPSSYQVGLSLSARERGLSQNLVLSWDLLSQTFLPARWNWKTSNFSLSLSLDMQALAFAQVRWEGTWQGRTWLVQLAGGRTGSTWEDLLVRGKIEGESWFVQGGLRLGFPGVYFKRLALSAEGVVTEAWSWAASWEFDFLTRTFVQAEAAVFRTFLGCLRVGLSVYPGGFRLSLDVPAFPEARVQFAPLDEGLRLGGL